LIADEISTHINSIFKLKKYNEIEKYVIHIWIKSLIILIISYLVISGISPSNFLHIKEIIFYSTASLIIAFILNYLLFKYNQSLTYILFFFITLCSILGLTKTLTGSHSESPSLYIYGISFYTVTLAYLSKVKKLNLASYFIAANPLLLITGPIATSFKVIHSKTLMTRFNYYFPFIILGVFLHQIIATPLTQTRFLIESTDLISTITYGLIFEIFVYSNFCGLSLIIFGIFGILGIRIPLNFRQPFSSKNLLEFWRGWHISFSIVLKELFYIPIKKKFGTGVAIFGVFLSSALWHGVSLNFIWWGLFHAICFSLTLILLRSNIKYISTVLLIVTVPFARILSSDDNINRLISKLHFNYNHFDALYRINDLGNHVKISIAFGSIFILLEILFRNKKLFISKNYKFYRTPAVQYGLVILIILFINSNGSMYAVYGQR
jgi:D-alanyl-lipoteichoic acid acyltransferase DltB (MBOAT superfamily)